jgi:hypothetical protein
MPWQERLSMRVSEKGKRARKFEHALPLSVARYGNSDTEEVRVAMTVLTGHGCQ